MTLFHEINSIPSTKQDLRRFGLTMAVAFGLIGGLLTWKGHAAGIYCLGTSGFFLAFGLVFPVALKPIQKIWMTLAFLMGWVMARVILSALFYAVLTPIGLILRLTGKDLLDARPGVSAASYWKAHKTRDSREYENQF